MKGPGHIFAFIIKAIKNRCGFRSFVRNDADIVVFNCSSNIGGYAQIASISRTDYQHFGFGGQYIRNIINVQAMSLVPPSVFLDPIANDLEILMIALAGDLHMAPRCIVFNHHSLLTIKLLSISICA